MQYVRNAKYTMHPEATKDLTIILELEEALIANSDLEAVCNRLLNMNGIDLKRIIQTVQDDPPLKESLVSRWTHPNYKMAELDKMLFEKIMEDELDRHTRPPC